MEEQEELNETIEEREDLSGLDSVPDFKVPETSEVIKNPLELYFSHYENNKERLEMEIRETTFVIKNLKQDYNKYLNVFSLKTHFIMIVENLIKQLERRLWLETNKFKTADQFAQKAKQITRDYYHVEMTKEDREEMMTFKMKEDRLLERDKIYIMKIEELLKDWESDETQRFIRKYMLNPIIVKEKYDASYYASCIRVAIGQLNRFFKDKPKEKEACLVYVNKAKQIYKEMYKVDIM